MAAILAGPSGSGKSLCLELIAKELGYELVEEDSLDQDVGFAQQRSIFHRGKLIVVDLDVVDVDRADTLIKASAWPVALSTDDVYQRRLYGLRKRFPMIRFQRVGWWSIFCFLKKICQAEGIRYEDETLKRLALGCDGDVRAGLICLEVLRAEGVSMQAVESAVLQRRLNIFDVLGMVFGNSTGAEARQALSELGQDAFAWIEENAGIVYRDARLAQAYACLALADLFRAKVVRRQAWQLERYYYDFLASLPRAELGSAVGVFRPPKQ